MLILGTLNDLPTKRLTSDLVKGVVIKQQLNYKLKEGQAALTYYKAP